MRSYFSQHSVENCCLKLLSPLNNVEEIHDKNVDTTGSMTGNDDFQQMKVCLA